MRDLGDRVTRLERELRIWRLAALIGVAGGIVVACRHDDKPKAEPGPGVFTKVTVRDGDRAVTIDPRSIAIGDGHATSTTITPGSISVGEGEHTAELAVAGVRVISGEQLTVLGPANLKLADSSQWATLAAGDITALELRDGYSSVGLTVRHQIPVLTLQYDDGHQQSAMISAVAAPGDRTRLYLQGSDDHESALDSHSGVVHCTPQKHGACKP